MLFLDLNKQYQKIKEKVDQRLQKVLKEGQFILGPEVIELEKQLALFVGVKHCITVGNGTDALTIALMAIGIQRGDEVITTPFSFAATTEAICLLGATPVFVDIDPNTYLIDPSKIAAAITEKTKAILAVSLFGQCVDFNEINDSLGIKNIPVIEDAAQSFGATYQNRRSCSLSALACTSFFPSKPLACYGDGGACFTNDDEIAAKLKQIRVHGQSARYQHTLLGVNSRLDTLQAAVLLEKLAIFPEEIASRRRIAHYYQKLLGYEIKTPVIHSDNTSVYAQYTIETTQREELKNYLHKQGIPTAIHYSKPLYLQPAFQSRCRIVGNMKNTEYAVNHVLSLPMHAYLEKPEICLVADAIKEFSLGCIVI
ncbi:MAG: DegT/DnrJ/EryC1/StrS family aminotransferase [Pseudomonadota bacterium]